jgi:uncharacterized protein
VDRLVLDANILFSAAYRDAAGLARFWSLKNVVLLSSRYAVEEARLNLRDAEQRTRLAALVSRIQVVPNTFLLPLPDGIDLPEKDRPILLSAIGARATRLITGDEDDFGQFFGRAISGVLILPPAAYLTNRRA